MHNDGVIKQSQQQKSEYKKKRINEKKKKTKEGAKILVKESYLCNVALDIKVVAANFDFQWFFFFTLKYI